MGKVGEKLEGLESYLWVVLEREEVVRGGGSTAGGGRRRYCAAVAAFRRGVEVMAGPGIFVGTRANGFGGWWGSALARAAARRGGAAMAMAGVATGERSQAGGVGKLGRCVRESEEEQSSTTRCGSERRSGARKKLRATGVVACANSAVANLATVSTHGEERATRVA
jgi:hypothetical protein